jgi:hypothetical protein
MYPDYSYPSQKQGSERRVVASVISTTPKPKNIKVLTHRPMHIETAEVPKLAEGPSSSAETSDPATAEAQVESTEEPISKTAVEQPKTLSSLQEAELLKLQNFDSVTPRRRRMASVLDVVMESTRIQTPASTETPSMGDKSTKESAETAMKQVETEVGLSAPAEAAPTKIAEKETESRPSDAGKVPLPLEKERATKGSKFSNLMRLLRN